LSDVATLKVIAEATGADPDTPVVELGAGLGALTFHLAQRGGRVVAIERDRELAPLLAATMAWAKRVEIREANAAELDYQVLAGELGGRLVVAGNLPYHLSSRILVELARARPFLQRVVIMVQREVAERVSAAPGSRTYGLLSVLVQRALVPRVIRHVPPGAFFPRPKVHSAVLLLEPTTMSWPKQLDRWFVITARAAFSSRRKMVRNALAGGLEAPVEVVEQALAEARIDPRTRAETLSVCQIAELGRALAALGALPASS
jgi:16S rRNA (adenine1518-N6/adenine1519-N6)-dimethyltransferase